MRFPVLPRCVVCLDREDSIVQGAVPVESLWYGVAGHLAARYRWHCFRIEACVDILVRLPVLRQKRDCRLPDVVCIVLSVPAWDLPMLRSARRSGFADGCLFPCGF